MARLQALVLDSSAKIKRISATDTLLVGKGISAADGTYGRGQEQSTSEIQTTDAVQATVATLTLDENMVYWLEAVVVAGEAAGANRAYYVRQAIAYRQGAGAVLGAIETLATDETDTSWDVTFDVSGNDVRVRVTGAAASTINWVCTLRHQGAVHASAGGGFSGGALTEASVWDALNTVATADDATVQTEANNLTIAGEVLGAGFTWAKASHATEYVLDSEAAWDALLGVGDDDARPALVYIDAPLVTISHNPARRRPFIAMAGPGELALSVDVGLLGANHSASGSNLTAARILWRVGTFGGVVDPEVPAAGGAGASGVTGAAGGTAGTAGLNGATGGGGSGAAGASTTSGAGAAGTSFSGGSGSGAIGGGNGGVGEDAEDRGGEGGDAGDGGSTACASGGAGNPGGTFVQDVDFAEAGDSFTGGVGYFAFPTISGAGNLVADGGAGGNSTHNGGGGAGGGSVTAQADVTSGWTGSPRANGGAGGTSSFSRPGGKGGDGTARTIPLTEDP